MAWAVEFLQISCSCTAHGAASHSISAYSLLSWSTGCGHLALETVVWSAGYRASACGTLWTSETWLSTKEKKENKKCLILFYYQDSIFIARELLMGFAGDNTTIYLSNLQLMGIWVISNLLLLTHWCYGISCTCFLMHICKSFSREVVLKVWSQHQITWELARNAKSWLPLQTYWIRNAGRGLQQSVLTSLCFNKVC